MGTKLLDLQICRIWVAFGISIKYLVVEFTPRTSHARCNTPKSYPHWMSFISTLYNVPISINFFKPRLQQEMICSDKFSQIRNLPVGCCLWPTYATMMSYSFIKTIHRGMAWLFKISSYIFRLGRENLVLTTNLPTLSHLPVALTHYSIGNVVTVIGGQHNTHCASSDLHSGCYCTCSSGMLRVVWGK